MKKKDKKQLIAISLAAMQFASGLEALPVLAQNAPAAPTNPGTPTTNPVPPGTATPTAPAPDGTVPTAPPLTVPPTNPNVGAPAVPAPGAPVTNPGTPAVPTAPGTPSVAATAVPQAPLPPPPAVPTSIADARNTASEQTPPLLLEDALVLAIETSPQRAAARAALAAAEARIGTARSAGGLQVNLSGSAQLTHNVAGGFGSFGSTSSSGGLNGGIGTGGTGTGTGGTGTGGTGTGIGTGGTGTGGTGTGGTGTGTGGTGGIGTGTGTGGTGTGTGGTGTGTGGIGTGTGGTGGIGVGTGGTGGIGTGTGNPVQNVSFNQSSASGSSLRRNETTGTTGGTNSGNTGTTNNNFFNHNESLSLSATYPLYNGGRIRASTREAQHAALAQAAQTLQTESDILLATTNSYLSVLRAGQLLDVTESNLAVAQERRRVAGVRYSAGAAARLEVLTADTVLADAIQRRIAASDSLAQSKANLNTLIGRQPETPLRVEPIASLLPRIPFMIGVTGPNTGAATPGGAVSPGTTQGGAGAATVGTDAAALTPAVGTGGATPTTKIDALAQSNSAELRALSDRSRASLQAAQEQVNVAQAGVDLARAQRRPNIGVSLTGLLNNPISAFVKRFGALLGLNLAQSLVDSGRTRSQIAEARATLDQARNNLQLQRINLYSQIEQALLAYDSAQNSVASADTAVASSQEAVRAAQLGYAAGVRTSLDVSDAQNNLLQAQTNAVNARFDAAIAQVLLASSVGTATEAAQTAYERALREEAQRVLATQAPTVTKVSKKKRR